MQSVDCPFCDHANPAGAKFCNECGSPLHFAPCKQCGAVNHVDDAQCHRCGVLLASPADATQAVPPGPPAEHSDQRPIGLEAQAHWLEEELRQYEHTPVAVGQEPSEADADRSIAGGGASDAVEHTLGAVDAQGAAVEAPGAITHELGAADEDGAAVEAPRAIAHGLGIPDPAATASEYAPHVPVHDEPGGSTQRPRAFDHGPRADALGRRRSGLAYGRANIPEARLLFSEIADERRTRWREYAAGVFAMLLVLAIGAGGYLYYREHLAPGSAALEGDTPVTRAPAPERRTRDPGESTVAAMLPLAKDAPASVRQERLPAAQPVKSAIAGDIGDAPKRAPAPAAAPAARGSDAATTAEPASRTAEAHAQEAPQAPASAPQCPPAVAALALCDWVTHADQK
jgi:hypothetical protein